MKYWFFNLSHIYFCSLIPPVSSYLTSIQSHSNTKVIQRHISTAGTSSTFWLCRFCQWFDKKDQPVPISFGEAIAVIVLFVFRAPYNKTRDVFTVLAGLDWPSWLLSTLIVRNRHRVREITIIPKASGRSVKIKSGKDDYALISSIEQFMRQISWLAKKNTG